MKKMLISFIVICPIVFFTLVYLDLNHFGLWESQLTPPSILLNPGESPKYECFRTQSQFTEALKKYNSKKSVKMTTFNENALRENGFLPVQHEMVFGVHPCSYKVSENETVYCTYHGESNPSGKYKPSPKYFEYLQRQKNLCRQILFKQYGSVLLISSVITVVLICLPMLF